MARNCRSGEAACSGTTMSTTPLNTDPKRETLAYGRRRYSLVGARLQKHADYQSVYANARKRQSASMSWFLAPQAGHGGAPRVGLTVGKLLGKAHDRNRIKRRMREILRRHLEMLPPGLDLVLHPRRVVLTAEFTKLDAEIVRILGQAAEEAARMTQPAVSEKPSP
jgi:ribonuclease P protein component